MKTEFERCNGVAARCMFTFAKLGDSEVCGECGGRADLFGRLSCLHLKDCRRKTRRLESPPFLIIPPFPLLFSHCARVTVPPNPVGAFRSHVFSALLCSTNDK